MFAFCCFSTKPPPLATEQPEQKVSESRPQQISNYVDTLRQHLASSLLATWVTSVAVVALLMALEAFAIASSPLIVFALPLVTSLYALKFLHNTEQTHHFPSQLKSARNLFYCSVAVSIGTLLTSAAPLALGVAASVSTGGVAAVFFLAGAAYLLARKAQAKSYTTPTTQTPTHT
jgi:hypothetical protein